MSQSRTSGVASNARHEVDNRAYATERKLSLPEDQLRYFDSSYGATRSQIHRNNSLSFSASAHGCAHGDIRKDKVLRHSEGSQVFASRPSSVLPESTMSEKYREAFMKGEDKTLNLRTGAGSHKSESVRSSQARRDGSDHAHPQSRDDYRPQSHSDYRPESHDNYRPQSRNKYYAQQEQKPRAPQSETANSVRRDNVKPAHDADGNKPRTPRPESGATYTTGSTSQPYNVRAGKVEDRPIPSAQQSVRESEKPSQNSKQSVRSDGGRRVSGAFNYPPHRTESSISHGVPASQYSNDRSGSRSPVITTSSFKYSAPYSQMESPPHGKVPSSVVPPSQKIVEVPSVRDNAHAEPKKEVQGESIQEYLNRREKAFSSHASSKRSNAQDEQGSEAAKANVRPTSVSNVASEKATSDRHRGDNADGKHSSKVSECGSEKPRRTAPGTQSEDPRSQYPTGHRASSHRGEPSSVYKREVSIRTVPSEASNRSHETQNVEVASTFEGKPDFDLSPMGPEDYEKADRRLSDDRANCTFQPNVNRDRSQGRGKRALSPGDEHEGVVYSRLYDDAQRTNSSRMKREEALELRKQMERGEIPYNKQQLRDAGINVDGSETNDADSVEGAASKKPRVPRTRQVDFSVFERLSKPNHVTMKYRIAAKLAEMNKRETDRVAEEALKEEMAEIGRYKWELPAKSFTLANLQSQNAMFAS